MKMIATAAERDQLRRIIEQWNENRLDLFSLTEPNDELEFHGVMRFYFQEMGQKVATKCIRVSSTATGRAVIEALVEKFHPDLKMLTTPSYSLWEVHENGEERKLSADEKPLLVQLNWHKDDREGRFLLRKEGADQYLPLGALQLNDPGMKRKYSKREKKELKRAQKEAIAKQQQSFDRAMEAEDVSTKLYTEVPPTTFTRTISNPEIVMKKRRERKLEQRLREMGEGGSLKVYGTELHPSKPYVTLLVSSRDRAEKLVKETLEKYGLDRQDPADYCLVEVTLPANENAAPDDLPEHQSALSERVLDDDEVPLLNLAQRTGPKANIVFHVRARTGDMPRGRRRAHLSGSSSQHGGEGRPVLVELNPDGSEVQGEPKVHYIEPNVTEVGSDRSLTQPGTQSLPLFGPYVHPRHCVLAFMDGVVTLTPVTSTCEIQVNAQKISETTILRNGSVIRIGRSNVFKFLERGMEGGTPFSSASLPRSQSMPNSQTQSVSKRSPVETTFSGPEEEGIEMVALELETTFDVDGDIKTVAVGPNSCEPVPQSPLIRSPFVGRDSIPAIIELLDNAEDNFLSVVVRDVDPNELTFKLSPVYVLYMCCRYRVSPHYRTSLLPEERALKLADFLTKTVNLLHVTIQDHCHDSTSLAFWMANCSELLNFVKLDGDLGGATHPEPQESMADAVQKAFGHLTSCLQQELNAALPAVLDPNLDDVNSTNPCLHMLSEAMALLRHCRVNAALTIQLFSQLFHYINMYLFNWLVSREGANHCCRAWGHRLYQRLGKIQTWALKQGLELAAECHLDRIAQAVKLLQTPKTVDHLATLGQTCYKLNSVQVRNLLERYKPDSAETPVSVDLIESVVKLAENQADEMLRTDGRSVQVEEDPDLQLPFLLPEDAYSPDVVRGIPVGLQQFLDFLMHKGVCRMIPQPGSSGTWSVHLRAQSGSQEQITDQPLMEEPSGQPEVAQISFPKGDAGIGLSIVAAQGVGQPTVGIYVKKVVPGSAAERDGRLDAGDQLLSVNGRTLVGITQEEAARKMAQSGSSVSFEVAKQAALYNGLASVLYQQSPQVLRYPTPRMHSEQNINTHPRYTPSPHMNGPVPLHTRVGSATSGLAQSHPVRGHHQNTMPPPVNYQPPQHARSMSASNLQHDGVQRPYVNGGHRVPDQQQYHNLPHYQTPYSPSQQQRPTHYPRQFQPSPSPVEYGSLVNGAVYSRRTPSVDDTRIVRAPHSSVSSEPRSPALVPSSPSVLRHSAVPDYQNLPLVTPTAAQVVNGRPSSQVIYSNNEFASQEPYLPSATQHQSSRSLDAQMQSPRLSPRELNAAHSPVWQAEQRVQVEQQIDCEVTRLIQEQVSLLEQKEYLTEAEERRYKALKFEITYRQRLVEEQPNSRTSGPRTTSEELKFMSDIASDPNDMQGFNASNGHPPPVAHPPPSQMTYSPAGAELHDRLHPETTEQLRQNRRDEYFAEAEQRLREEARARQQSSPPHDAPEMIQLQKQMEATAMADERFAPVPPAPKPPPPAVPPKRRVQFVGEPMDQGLPASPPPLEESYVVHEPQEHNGYGTQPEPSHRYVFDASESKRTQVLGGQEVYRDPRAQRLNRLHEAEAQKTPRVDGSNLAFREKMRLFAQQIGENTPKDKMKVSSAQREIEDQINS